ncbi:hypothetical protein F5B22DRAFT_282505 [Xylaria bambusicola]|uniref:uncharacterized protein n=1 Tax=Xylaria bambusicola TaxID=326684 RepID=UPI002008DB24|nr:uncharacterized protein F5B22DRAFT_282505 [Xylaria bambusicola]KAI0512988.1 hypothetical protein F5B22DRAFT_282505 [Xylaria bambusicola]
MANHASSIGTIDTSTPLAIPHHRPRLFELPTELIDAILSYLTPVELVGLSLVCRTLRAHAENDLHWHRHVLANLPRNEIKSPYPCETWRALFVAHNQYWFLTRHKIWFCDRSLTGQMIIVRYDGRRGCIEGYQLLATRFRDGSEPWLADPTVHIHYFEPKIKLHLDKPILQFNVDRLENLMRISLSSPDSTTRPARRFFPEHPMSYSQGSDPRFSTFVLAKPIEEHERDTLLDTGDIFPYNMVWPPPTIPAADRVFGHPSDIAGGPTHDLISSPRWRPVKRSEVSDTTFRIRQWMELGPPTIGFHIGEECVTYSTLDPSLYTPTPERPWRGIWVGDYSVHGCEFLLINQPDIDEEGYKEPLVKLENESDTEFQSRFLAQKVYRGRLEAIKLTGDPNVPRGEYTFLADDLGEEGLVGIAQEPPFQGARIVRSRGHIAGIGFTDDKYIESQLILLSHNRLAQYWVDFGHISFFERVEIDQFLVPS